MPSSHYGSLGVQLQHSGGQKQKKKKERGRRRLNVSEENRKRLEKLARDAEKRQKQKESDAAAAARAAKVREEREKSARAREDAKRKLEESQRKLKEARERRAKAKKEAAAKLIEKNKAALKEVVGRPGGKSGRPASLTSGHGDTQRRKTQHRSLGKRGPGHSYRDHVDIGSIDLSNLSRTTEVARREQESEHMSLEERMRRAEAREKAQSVGMGTRSAPGGTLSRAPKRLRGASRPKPEPKVGGRLEDVRAGKKEAARKTQVRPTKPLAVATRR